MKTIIIDDEAQARESLKRMLNTLCRDIEIIAEAGSIRSASEAMQEHAPDLVFLDISLPDGNGFDLIPEINRLGIKVIFITAHDEYAVQAFKVSAADYLLKPVDPSELCNAVKKARLMVENDHLTMLNALIANLDKQDGELSKLVLKTSDSIFIVDISDIVRLESEGNYTRIFPVNKKPLMVSRTLKEYEEILKNSGFIRPHNSHLVNFDYVSRFDRSDGGYLVMKDGKIIPVAVRKKESLLAYLEKFSGTI